MGLGWSALQRPVWSHSEGLATGNDAVAMTLPRLLGRLWPHPESSRGQAHPQDPAWGDPDLLAPCPPPSSQAVGSECPLPTHLPRGLDALDHGHAHNGPGHEEAQGHLPVEAPALRDGVGDVQGLSVPEVGGGRALFTLRLHHCNGSRASVPRSVAGPGRPPRQQGQGGS